MATDQTRPGEQDTQLIVFRVGDEYYALDVLEIKEIVPMPRVTTVPNVPLSVMGIINLRGSVITVFSLRAVLGLSVSDSEVETKVIVVMIQDQAVGLAVNEVTETLKVASSEIEQLSEMLQRGATSYTRGVITLDSRLVLVLDTAQIMEMQAAN